MVNPNPNPNPNPNQAVTTTVTNYATACGIHFTDRPGIDIPGAQAQNAEGSASVEQMATTSSLLKRGSDFLAEQASSIPITSTRTNANADANTDANANANADANTNPNQARRVEWARQLRDLDRRLRSSSAEDRPLALVYVHHAAHRLYPDRVKELIRRVCCHTRARTLDEQTPGCCVYHTGLEPRTSRQGPTSRPRRRQVLFCYSHV